ncbi:MAG: TerB family tellurite resistance protein [Deltaproteobacteria bacterium]|nr:TerB family tellurite resistance protein [Deltaproteobacteria bacterium]
MIDLVKDFFGTTKGKEKDSAHDIRIATCALLLEMSQIDGDFSNEERDSIVSIICKDFDMPDDIASTLLDSSREELAGSCDLWQFTNLINKNYTQEEKTGIIEMVWRIAYTDRKLDKYEDFLVHKLANMLCLTHSQLIEAKVRVLEEIGIYRRES